MSVISYVYNVDSADATRYRPGAVRRYAAPADGSSIQKSRRIYVRLRTGPQSAHLWWSGL